MGRVPHPEAVRQGLGRRDVQVDGDLELFGCEVAVDLPHVRRLADVVGVRILSKII